MDWIKNKKNKPNDFFYNLPAILKRAKLVRKVLVFIKQQNPECGALYKAEADIESEVKGVHKLIYTKDLYDNEGEYLYYFLMNMIESCCLSKEVPLLVIRIALDHLKQLIDEEKIQLSHSYKEFAVYRLDKIRAEIVHEFYKLLQLEALTPPDYFEKLIQAHFKNSRFAEATHLIVNFDLLEKFDMLDLSLKLV